MIISPRIPVSSTLLALAALTLGVPSVRAACPDSPCDCLGEASSYRVVALDLLDARVGGPPYEFLRGSRIEGRACAFTAKLKASTVQDLYALAGAGEVAVRGPRSNISPPTVEDVLATGGGTVSGEVAAGTLDTTGTHPGIASCQQAAADIQAASQMLAMLSPTQVLPAIVEPYGPGFPAATITAGPGINVVKVEGPIILDDYDDLWVQLDPATDAVVINATKLVVREVAAISVMGGDDAKVIINIPGRGSAVVLRNALVVEPTILAPQRTARLKVANAVSTILARRVALQGAIIEPGPGVNTCSPSGAFLDSLEPL